MFVIRVCGVDLYKTENVLDFVTKLKDYQRKFGIEQVETICNDVSPAFPTEITLNVIILFKDFYKED